MVRRVLISSGIPYIEVADEAAFTDRRSMQVWSAIGREFTLATQPGGLRPTLRFNLKYMNNNNEPEIPICIHRAPLGTARERFIGFLIEHYAGNFPAWLAPVQVAVPPISDKFNDHAAGVVEMLKKLTKSALSLQPLREDRQEDQGCRDQKDTLYAHCGRERSRDGTVSVRKHGAGDQGSVTAEQFIEQINLEIEPIFS